MIYLLLAVIYIAFVGLGLPDSLLGAAWPSMYETLNVPVSYMGGISMIIAFCTVLSSLMSDRLTRRFGAGPVTAVSTAVTTAALFGFAASREYWMLTLWAVPFGLGAGNVDAALNNYVAIHYESKHMSWLHGMWGLGTIIGPNVISHALTGGMHWNEGYRAVGFIQIGLTAILVLSLPLWKKRGTAGGRAAGKPLSMAQILRIPGVKPLMLGPCFCYCALEQTAMLWGSSYLVLHCGILPETAALFAAMFLIGMTAGRFANGFLTLKLADSQLIRMGEIVIAAGVALMFLPFGSAVKLAGLMLIGLGCAPICPCTMHATPGYFGAEHSQAIIGLQSAASYLGILSMPPLFGLIANHIDVSLFPVYMLLILIVLVIAHERLLKKVR
ncbi:MAG: MFS transporter [Clostridia bacterium]|nr:MFS transporter [Clostridia bacterium]